MTGELAALTTAVLWTFTSIFFTISGQRVGSQIVNRTRLILGFLFLSSLHLIVHHEFLPLNTNISHWFWLGLSGIIGLVIGDSALFQAFVLIGPHLSMLIMTLVPIISSIFAWIFLKETLSLIKIFGIALTISGIILVVLKKITMTITNRKNFVLGILCAIIGAFGQAIGLIIAKRGLFNNFDGLSATLIRVSIATTVLWFLSLVLGKLNTTVKQLITNKAIFFIIAGAFCGPFLGIWMSMNAIKGTYIGIASTLMALPPIFLLPLSHFIFKEKITIQSILGTFVALTGTALIFLK